MINISKLKREVEKKVLEKKYQIYYAYFFTEKIVLTISGWNENMLYGNIWKEKEGIYNLKDSFNLKDPIEKQLGRINGFYDVLSSIEEDRLYMLYDSVMYDNKDRVKEAQELYRLREEGKTKTFMILLHWLGNGLEEGAYSVFYDYKEEKVSYNYGDMDIKKEDEIEGRLSRKEFNLLMQIYYGLYQDEKIREDLEEKEKNGEYEEVKKYVNDEMITEIFFKKERDLTQEEKKKLEEYLKLQLMRKPTAGAFSELEMEKIYDANWNEEEQKKVVEKVNKELGKEVVIIG